LIHEKGSDNADVVTTEELVIFFMGTGIALYYAMLTGNTLYFHV